MLTLEPPIIAHRGLSKRFVENTIEAFVGAYQANIPAIEFDLQLSRDNIPIVFHDRDLSRLSWCHELVAELDYQELLSIDLNSDNKNIQGAKVMSYEDLLRELGSKLVFFIEIKSYELKRAFYQQQDFGLNDDFADLLSKRDRYLINRVLELNHAYGCEAHCILVCFEPIILEYAMHLNPKLPCLLNLYPEQHYPKALLDKLWGIDIALEDLKPSHRILAQQTNNQLCCYCCDSKQQMDYARELGCDYMMSNVAEKFIT